MKQASYQALIRTFNSVKTLGTTISSLASQSQPPINFIVVDSGSTDGTLGCVPESAVVHRYVGSSFNYSESINQGLPYVTAEYVLIISSHTALKNPAAIRYALDLLESNEDIGAAYFIPGEGARLDHTLVDQRSFDGFNGVFNTCGVYRASLLKERKFRTDVLYAEDQEWSRWLFDAKGMSIARITGGGMVYNNPLGYFPAKRWGEYTSVALHAKPEMRRLLYIARVAYRVVKVFPWQPLSERLFNLRFLFFLTKNIDRSRWWW